MSEKLIRTFLSIPVPLMVRSKKQMLYSTLEQSPAKINWVKDEQLHITIKFIGHTPENLFDEIKIINDPQNYSILKVSQDSNGITEITLLAITPTGTTNLSFDFYTTKK